MSTAEEIVRKPTDPDTLTVGELLEVVRTIQKELWHRRDGLGHDHWVWDPNKVWAWETAGNIAGVLHDAGLGLESEEAR